MAMENQTENDMETRVTDIQAMEKKMEPNLAVRTLSLGLVPDGSAQQQGPFGSSVDRV